LMQVHQLLFLRGASGRLRWGIVHLVVLAEIRLVY
jgi:hypothetical protein